MPTFRTRVEVIQDMISAIPDGAANMRDSVQFTIYGDELLELSPWLLEWNQNKEGKFNGVWSIGASPPRPPAEQTFIVWFKATGM